MNNTLITSDLSAIRAAVSDGRCHGIVTRDWVEDACNKPAVTVIDATRSEDNCYWPACAFHANRWGRGRCVPLEVIAEALS